MTKCGVYEIDLRANPTNTWPCRLEPTVMLEYRANLANRFYQYYMINEQTYVGPYLQNLKYPDVKALKIEEFMRRVPLDQLPVVYSNPVTQRV